MQANFATQQYQMEKESAEQMCKVTHNAIFVKLNDRDVFCEIRLNAHKKVLGGFKGEEEKDFKFNAFDDVSVTYTISSGKNANSDPVTIHGYVCAMPLGSSPKFSADATLLLKNVNPATLKSTTVSMTHLEKGRSLVGKILNVKLGVRVNRKQVDNQLAIVRNASEAGAKIYEEIITNQLPNEAPRKNILVPANMPDEEKLRANGIIEAEKSSGYWTEKQVGAITKCEDTPAGIMAAAGPPGTGKTSLELRIGALGEKLGHCVVTVSSTNEAADRLTNTPPQGRSRRCACVTQLP